MNILPHQASLMFARFLLLSAFEAAKAGGCL
jgi:hypothetical protein